MGALDSCFGPVGPHQHSIPQLLSLVSHPYLVSLSFPYNICLFFKFAGFFIYLSPLIFIYI